MNAPAPAPDYRAMLRVRLAPFTGRRSPSLTATLNFACVAVTAVALVVLGIRSANRLDVSWDTFAYHLPFAARWGGLSIPYDMSDLVGPRFEGFPPLPELVQGLLWRLSGSVNATGVVNFMAFCLFLLYCHKVLRAPFWLVALISLTAPLVLIHTTVSYVDLFGNAFLAIGVCSCLYAYLFPEGLSRRVAVGGLAALTAAAWSKYLLVPVVGVAFIVFAVIVFRSASAFSLSRRQAAAILLVFATVAAAPYVKNLAVYGNPFWPERVPIAGTLFPYLHDGINETAASQRPAALRGVSQSAVFAQSLFETNVPTSYPDRDRWTIDQGNLSDASPGYRMGGFWGAGVVIYLAVAFGMLIVCRGREGIVACIAAILTLAVVSVVPQSHELRYFMFIPLVWAATVGMIYPQFRDRFRGNAPVLLFLVLALFGYMVSQNLGYYRIGKVDYRDAAVSWGAADWWPRLQHGENYCVVDMLPIGIMMTGPTMSEYSIVDRSRASLCPAGAIVVTPAGIQGSVISKFPIVLP